MAGSTRSHPKCSAEPGRFRTPLLFPLSRGRVGEGARPLAPCSWPGPLPNPPPQAGEGTRCGHWKRRVLLTIIATIAAGTSPATADSALRPYVIVGDAIPASLTSAPGDAARGKAIVASRQTGLCLLCHSAPLPEEKFQGTIGPDLKGAGSRNTEGQLRLRIVDSSAVNPGTIMPAYYRLDGLERVAPAFRGRTVLTAEQIEDVVAFLMTLRD
jgi:L-cysteine S-thiosulfotransferase